MDLLLVIASWMFIAGLAGLSLTLVRILLHLTGDDGGGPRGMV